MSSSPDLNSRSRTIPKNIPQESSILPVVMQSETNSNNDLPRQNSIFNFLNLISVEPLVFLAVVALYLEFPSIQDLIYTKICLQVVSNKTIHLLTQNNTNLTEFSSRLPDKRTSYVEDHLLCDRLNKSAVPKEMRQEITNGDALFWLKYEVLICALCALSSPYWGGMSDKIGRVIPLNVPIVMAIVSNALSLIFGLLISLKSHNLFQVEWLYIGALLTGLSGGQAVIMINSFGFLSDNTSSDSRSKRVVVLESVIYVAHSVGFYISKHIMSLGLEAPSRPWFNRHFVAFSTCILLNSFAVIYTILRLRHRKFHRFSNNFEREQQDSFAGDVLAISQQGINNGNGNSVERMRELTSSTPDDLDGPIVQSDKNLSDWGTIWTFKYYKLTYETLTKKRESRVIILLLLLCGFISAMSLASLMSLLFIYLHSDPFNWTTSQYSYWNSISSLTRGIALICLTLSKLFKFWNMPDPIVAALGFLSKGLGLMMIATAQSSDMIGWSILAFIPSEFSMPPIRSLLSKLVIKEEVGKVYSCLAALQSICILFGNIVFYLAYTSIGMKDFFRLTYLVVACFQFIAVIIMLLVYTTLRNKIMII